MTNSNDINKIIELKEKLQKANDILFQIAVTVVSVKNDKEAMSIIAKTCDKLGHDWDYNQKATSLNKKETRKEIKDLVRVINENRDFNS